MYEHMHVYLYNVVFDCISLIRTKCLWHLTNGVRITEDSLYVHLGIKVKLKMCSKVYTFADLQGHVIMYTYVYTVQLIPFSTYTRELSEFELVI